MAEKYYEGMYGVPLTISVQDDDGADVDISGADDYTILVTKPDDTTATWSTGVALSGTSDVTYTTVAGDTPTGTPGQYGLQVQVDNLSGFYGPAGTAFLEVHERGT